MTSEFRRFLNDESAATAVEYSLIVAVLSLAIVGGLSQVTNSLTYLFGNSASKLNSAWTH